MVTLTILYLDNPAIEPVLAMASMAVGVAILLFTVVLWQHTRTA